MSVQSNIILGKTSEKRVTYVILRLKPMFCVNPCLHDLLSETSTAKVEVTRFSAILPEFCVFLAGLNDASGIHPKPNRQGSRWA